MVAPRPLTVELVLASSGLTLDTFTHTSESVSEGHPDKVADQISDAILDAHLEQDPNARVACETLVTTNLIVIAGEITSKATVDYVAIARQVCVEIGYDSDELGFNGNTCEVQVRIDQQSPDIAQGVNDGDGLYEEQGAGDQGMMHGFACDETPEAMPLSAVLSHRLLGRLTKLRKEGAVDWLRPDSKSQVTVEYRDGKPFRVVDVVISTQHSPKVDQAFIEDWVIEHVIEPVIPAELLNLDNEELKAEVNVNPTGAFEIGGPHGDCGLTGRKIIVDTYAGWAGHGGGAFSGKDPSKVDRSAAYMGRYIAKHLVKSGLCTRAHVELSYAIGMAEPRNLKVNSFGTGVVPDAELAQLVRECFPLKPAALIEHLRLKSPGYRTTASLGHFGRTGPRFTWEVVERSIEDRLWSLASVDKPEDDTSSSESF